MQTPQRGLHSSTSLDVDCFSTLLPRDAPIHHKSKELVSEAGHDCQYPGPSSIGQLIAHEFHAPALTMTRGGGSRALPAYRGSHCEPFQQILWICERMHPHAYDVLRGAACVVMEKYQSAPISGRCCPALTILKTHREPMAFIEIVRSNRPTNSLRAAEELGISLFTILVCHRRLVRPGLQLSRPWWDFDPTLPEDDRRQMYLMEQVADELVRLNSQGDSTWASLDKVIDANGNIGTRASAARVPICPVPRFRGPET